MWCHHFLRNERLRNVDDSFYVFVVLIFLIVHMFQTLAQLPGPILGARMRHGMRAARYVFSFSLSYMYDSLVRLEV